MTAYNFTKNKSQTGTSKNLEKKTSTKEPVLMVFADGDM